MQSEKMRAILSKNFAFIRIVKEIKKTQKYLFLLGEEKRLKKKLCIENVFFYVFFFNVFLNYVTVDL